VRADSRFQRPRDLDGGTYGGFGLPGEKEIIQAIIRNDGGKGDFKTVTLDTGAYDAVYAKRVDFAEGYLTWEVIEAKLRGIKLRLFPLDKYGIPDFYSVVLACNSDWLRKNPAVAKRFIAATVKGWQFTQAHPSEASALLIKQNPGVFSNSKLVYQSDDLLARSYLLDAQGRFGCQTLQEWTAYPKFLYQVKAYKDRGGKTLTTPPNYGQLFTNAYLPYKC
jgi:ABC-type nitrate/sulfonate/bicarbonate transport system substrate-binding protein